MDAAALDDLLSAEGQAALAMAAHLAPTPATQLAALTKLRTRFAPRLAADALEMQLLRDRARVKFDHAAKMLFTREALEMASSQAVARHRAHRFAAYARVLDLGCGIGGDTLELARVTAVEAVEADPVHARMAEWNLAANGLTARVHTLDILADPLPAADAAFADPGRRAGGRRFLSLKDLLPPPDRIAARFPPGFPLAFKLAPGVDVAELAAFAGEAEFVMLDGELKECVLWLGPLGVPGRRRATLLTGETRLPPSPCWGDGHTERSDGRGEGASTANPLSPVRPAVAPTLPPTGGGWTTASPSNSCLSGGSTFDLFADDIPSVEEPEPIGAILYDPAAAVVRAGLVPLLVGMVNGVPTDYTVQMLSAEEHVPTPFATAYRVEAVLKFDARTVRAWLKANDVGRVTVVTRGATADAAKAAEGWKLSGSRHRFVVVTRQLGEQVVVIGERIAS